MIKAFLLGILVWLLRLFIKDKRLKPTYGQISYGAGTYGTDKKVS